VWVVANVKTAISVDEVLFEQANALAREMGIPRSQVFARALEDYLRRRENRRLLDEINAALGDDPQSEEIENARRMRRMQRATPDAEW
jgi:metal-responsive CopG/Arc/MetJ family transcriptional regulator